METDSSIITKEFIDEIQNQIGDYFELDYYRDGSVDILDRDGNYITAVYTVHELKTFLFNYIGFIYL